MDVNNQGLNLPSNLQNLDVRNELLSKEVGSGASCAYSLRDLTGSNKKAVRVRREPHDETNSIDDERIFGGQEVQAGYLEDWVNGKLEHTLPCDVATASAGYSLRKIKSSYSGNAVRIRRDSDSIEVDVAFDSDDKVSASSAITNVAEQGGESGSTTATDLNEFLNEKLTVGTAVNGTGSYPYDSFTANGNTGFTVTNDGVAQVLFPYKTAINDVVVVNFDLNITNGTPSPGIATRSATNSVSSKSNSTVVSSNGNHTVTMTCNADGTHIGFSDAHTGTYTVSNFEIVSHTHSAFVHTWYDQAGSNDAVQTTASNQPKIADNGALLADANGNATLDFPNTSGLDTIRLETDFVGDNLNSLSVYCVCQSDSTNTLGNATYAQVFTQGSYSSDERFYIAIKKDTANFQVGYGTGFHDLGVPVDTNQRLFSINAGTYIESNVNAVKKYPSSGNQVSQDKAITRSSSFIGGHTTTDAPWDGTISELIYYNSDQSDNRFKIESNINNYYGLYNDHQDLSESSFSASFGTISNNSKDGFDFTTNTTQSFVGIKLNKKIPVGEKVYLSFNITHDAYSESTLVGLRKTSFTGTNASTAIATKQNGFNAVTLTSNDADAEYVTFQIRQDSPTVTVRDFKVSYIARNGFVETLYDQSGNSRDASQGTAGSQPFIVMNGGQVKLQNQPSIDFDGRGSTSARGLVTDYDISSDGSLTEYSIYAVFDNTVVTPHSTLISAGQPITNSSFYGGFNVFVNQNGGRLEIEHQEHPNTSKTTVRPVNSYTTGDGYKILTINYNSSSLLSKFVNVTSGSSAESTSPALPKARDDIAIAQYLKIGTSYTFQYRDSWQGFISEIIMFEDDIRSDNDDIVNNLTDFYGQPSSTP